MTRTIVASIALLAVSALVTQPSAAQSAQDDQALAKQSQNPIANLISLPLQNNTDFGQGLNDATVNTLNIQPVYPVTIGKWNMINRAILPVIWQGEVVAGIGSEFGLGDLSYTAFFSPAEAGTVTWGVGWSAGLGGVVLAMTGQWVLGALAQNVWSFAGDSARSDVNFLLSQYFINYNFPNFYLSSAPIITANWEAASGQKWTIPFGGGAGKLFRLGKMPVDGQVQVFYNAVKPDDAADWTLRLQFKMLFPK
jgi:hypothetical protein